MYRCITDRYDPDGSNTYASVAEFLAMCQAVLGATPDLREQGGDYYDSEGLVLERRDD